MSEQLVIQQFLQKKLAELQAANPRYSLRAFARKAGLNPGALSGILNGKRNVSTKLVERIADRLLLDPQERAELFAQFRVIRRAPAPEGDAGYRKLSAAQFKVVAEWEHLAVLSLMRTRGFRGEPAWIAARLGLTVPRAREVVRRLIESGMARLDESGALVRSAPPFRTTDDVADASLRRSHSQSLELAARSLERDPVEARDHTWLMLAMSPAKLRMAKERIRRFQDELAELVEAGDQTEVYRLSMHLFPLTEPGEPHEL